MKVVAKPIEMIAIWYLDGSVHPKRFSVPDTKLERVDVDRIIEMKKEKLAGNPMLVFTCQSNINDRIGCTS